MSIFTQSLLQPVRSSSRPMVITSGTATTALFGQMPTASMSQQKSNTPPVATLATTPCCAPVLLIHLAPGKNSISPTVLFITADIDLWRVVECTNTVCPRRRPWPAGRTRDFGGKLSFPPKSRIDDLTKLTQNPED